MTVYVPELSARGWISQPLEKASKLMAHFYASEKSQSTLLTDDVHSFPFILQKNLNNPSGLEEDLEKELKYYFSKYFENVMVVVKVYDEKPGSSKQIVEFSIRFDQDGKSYDLTQTRDLEKSDYERYTHLNNTGELL